MLQFLCETEPDDEVHHNPDLKVLMCDCDEEPEQHLKIYWNDGRVYAYCRKCGDRFDLNRKPRRGELQSEQAKYSNDS